MTTRQAIEHMLDELSEEQMRVVLDFTRSLTSDPDAASWRLAGRQRLAQAYGGDEPEYTEAMVRSRRNEKPASQ